jgi:hypothetical protein
MALLIWGANLLQGLLAQRAGASLWTKGFLAGLLVLLAAATRQAGITLAVGFAALLLWQALNGQRSWARTLMLIGIVSIPAILTLLGLAWWDRATATGPGALTYLDQVRGEHASWPSQILEGTRLRVSEVGRILIPGMFKAYGRPRHWLNLNLVLFFFSFVVVVAGWRTTAFRNRDLLAWVFPFYILLYIVWPFDQATRFMAPLTPLFMYCAWSALDRLVPYRKTIFAVLVAAHLAVSAGHSWLVELPRGRVNDAQWDEASQLGSHLPPETVALAASGVAPDTVWMLQFLADRRIPIIDQCGVQPHKAWLIVGRAQKVPEGFSVRAKTETLRLAIPVGEKPKAPRSTL